MPLASHSAPGAPLKPQVTASPQSTQGHTGQEAAALLGPTPNKTKQHSETGLHEELEPISSAFLLFFHSHIQANLQTRQCKPKGRPTVLTTPAAGQTHRGWTGVAAGVGAVSALWTLRPTPSTPASPAFKGVRRHTFMFQFSIKSLKKHRKTLDLDSKPKYTGFLEKMRKI